MGSRHVRATHAKNLRDPDVAIEYITATIESGVEDLRKATKASGAQIVIALLLNAVILLTM